MKHCWDACDSRPSFPHTQAPPARSLESSLQGVQQDGSAAEQQKAAPGKVATGSLAQAVAAAMHSPEGAGGNHREWLQQQQQQLGASGCASMTSSMGSVGGASHSHRGSDQDTPLLRYQGGAKGSGPGAGASLAATAAAQQQQQQQGSGGQPLSARKGQVKGPTLSGRPSPLKLGPKSNAAAPGGMKSHSNSSSREDVVRDADQAKLAAA